MSSFTDNFETIFSVKDNIQALRNKVLELAIHGRLVKQNPNDQPASGLVKKTISERAELMANGKISKQVYLNSIAMNEIPFKIPENWEWVKLDDITEYIQRGKSPIYSEIERYPVIAQKCIQWSGVSLEKALYIEPSSIEKYSIERFLTHGDILWNSTGTGSCGRVGKFTDLIRNGHDQIVADSHVTVIRCIKKSANFEYIFIWLSSPEVQSVIESKAFGSTNQIELATSTIKEYLISLPPREEQDRIVDKVEYLMSKIDRLEEFLKKKEHLLALLPQTVVDAIGGCKTGEDLERQLRFVVENLENTFQTPESMQDLRDVILQLAIEGKLVKQDESVEAASELIKKIKLEQHKLIKLGIYKSQKTLLPIKKEDIPFEIPESWKWVRFGEIIFKLTDGAHLTPKYTDTGVPFLSVKDMSSGRLDFSNTRHIAEAEHFQLYKRCNPERGDLLITKVGTTGIPIIVDTDKEFSLFVSVALVKFDQELLFGPFLKYFIKSPYVKKLSE